MRKALAILVAISAALPAAGSSASTERRTAGHVIERAIASAASRAGMSVDEALDSVQTIEIVRADGTTVTRSMTTRAIIARLDGVETRSAGPGLAEGVPEILAGDLTHLYVEAGSRSKLRYSVTTSATIPSTPGAAVADPVTGLPLFTEYGGPTIQVKGSGWDLGGHGAGYAVGGLNVDLAEGGPYVAPVAVALIEDASIDFVGHGSVAQACLTLPFLGCVASFGLLISDGLAVFDSGPPIEIPILP